MVYRRENSYEDTNQRTGWASHPLFVAIMGAVVGAFATGVVGFFFSPFYQVDHYIPVDDLNTYVETSLVKTGYVDSSILELETYGEKLDAIKRSFSAYSDAVEVALTALGVDENTLSGLSDEQRLIVLADTAEDVYASSVQAQSDIAVLTAEVSDLGDASQIFRKPNQWSNGCKDIRRDSCC